MSDCLAPRHDEPAEAEAHAVLCRPCRVGLARDLRRLPGLHADLAEDLINSAATGSGFIANVSNCRGASPGDDGETQHVLHVTALPFNEAVSECRSQIRHDIAWWTKHAAGELELPLPDVRLDAMCDWLWDQVRWLVFRDWAGDMAAAIGADASRAYFLLQRFEVTQFDAPGSRGVCPECGEGRLHVSVPRSGSDRRPPAVTCQGCGKVWHSLNWRRMGELILRREAMAS